MKLSLLRHIIKQKAHELSETAENNGKRHDGGASQLLKKLDEYEQNLIVSRDLKPSEVRYLDEMEVGEPIKFQNEIYEFKNPRK